MKKLSSLAFYCTGDKIAMFVPFSRHTLCGVIRATNTILGDAAKFSRHPSIDIAMSEADKEFVEFFRSKYGLVLHTARRLAPDPSLAQDIAQQVFLEFLKDAKRKKWKLHKEGKPLLYQITKNVARKFWRQYQRDNPKSLRERVQCRSSR